MASDQTYIYKLRSERADPVTQAYRHYQPSLAALWMNKLTQIFPPYLGFMPWLEQTMVRGTMAFGGNTSQVYGVMTVRTGWGGQHLTLIRTDSSFKGVDWPVLLSQWPSHRYKAAQAPVSFGGIIQGSQVKFFVRGPGDLIFDLGLWDDPRTAFCLHTEGPQIEKILREIRLIAARPEHAWQNTQLQAKQGLLPVLYNKSDRWDDHFPPRPNEILRSQHDWKWLR